MDCPAERFDAVLDDPLREGPAVAHHLLQGANYFSIGPNPLVFWLEYDPARIESELDLAKSARVNSLRVWVSHEAYLVRGERVLDDLDHFLRTACERGIVLLLVLTDFAFGWNGKGAVERWSGTPGVFLMGDVSRHPQYFRFLDGVLERVGRFPPYLVMFDVANEPFSNPWLWNDPATGAPSLSAAARGNIVTFLIGVFERIRTQLPANERTVGQSIQGVIGQPDFLEQFPLTFQSFHGGYDDAVAIRDLAASAVAKSPLPVVLTETCADPALLPAAVRVAREFDVGFMFWGLMKGYNEWNSWTGLFHRDGAVTSKEGVAALLGKPADDFEERPHSRSTFPVLDVPAQLHVALKRLARSRPVDRDNVDEMRSLPWELLHWGYFLEDNRAAHLALGELHLDIEKAYEEGQVERAHRLIGTFVEKAARSIHPRRPGAPVGTIPHSLP